MSGNIGKTQLAVIYMKRHQIIERRFMFKSLPIAASEGIIVRFITVRVLDGLATSIARLRFGGCKVRTRSTTGRVIVARAESPSTFKLPTTIAAATVLLYVVLPLYSAYPQMLSPLEHELLEIHSNRHCDCLFEYLLGLVVLFSGLA